MRPSTSSYFLLMAELVATRATCRRRKVGCILVNERNHVLATGYNGVPRGFPHCIAHPCPGAEAKPGEELHTCLATHAEQNALLQCPDTEDIHTVYVTASPCIHCVKLFLNTGAKQIIFLEEYPHPEAKALWCRKHPRGTWRKGRL